MNRGRSRHVQKHAAHSRIERVEARIAELEQSLNHDDEYCRNQSPDGTANSADSHAIKVGFCQAPAQCQRQNDTSSKADVKKIAGSQSCANSQSLP